MRRISATIGEADESRLEEITEVTKLSQNDAIRKAIATEAFMQRNLSKGAKILLEMPDGTIRQIEFVN